MKKRYSLVETTPVIQIFKRGSRKVFCEIEVPNEEYMDEIKTLLNAPSKFILIGQLLIDKSEISHIIFKN